MFISEKKMLTESVFEVVYVILNKILIRMLILY